jgi:hypothetical protein
MITVAEKTQHGKTAVDRVGPRHPAPLHRDRIGRQGEADDRNAGGRILARGVGDETVDRIHRFQEVSERGVLKRIEQGLVCGFALETGVSPGGWHRTKLQRDCAAVCAPSHRASGSLDSTTLYNSGTIALPSALSLAAFIHWSAPLFEKATGA